MRLARLLLIGVLVSGSAAFADTPPAPSDLPVVEVTADNTVIARSCRIVISPGTVLTDADDNGILQITASDIEVEFAAGSVLAGSPEGTDPDQYRGTGIRLDGVKNVTVRGARLRGFWTGLWATKTDGLTLEAIDASDNRRAHLGSTPDGEDYADWLCPYYNDNNEWLTRYGAALYVEDSADVTVRRCRVHQGQNALCLDRLTGAKVYDNDFSFNSGWGVALWRCERCVITRNAIDFNVRGYSHKVYNRGQDSADLLVFEQNIGHVIAENSVTHGGDGFFGGSGLEALGQSSTTHPDEWYKRRGNTDNLLVDNDFSYAPAHGVETTFSFGFRVLNNRMVGNAICGVWGGFSRDLLVAGNTFEDNGEGAYGDQRGGINIDHGAHNRVIHNTFRNNQCGVHYWWSDTQGFNQKPWGRLNGTESTDNLIADNTFIGDVVVFHFYGRSDGKIGANTYEGCPRLVDTTPDVTIFADPSLKTDAVPVPDHPVLGETHPVGARPELRGRENIIMTEWGPWDHTSPLVRPLRAATETALVYELRLMPAAPAVEPLPGSDPAVRATLTQGDDGFGRLTIDLAPDAETGCAHPYAFRLTAGNFTQDLRGALIATVWDAAFFNWTDETDPLKHLDAYRGLADAAGAVKVQLKDLSHNFGYFEGPANLGLPEASGAARVKPDHFGLSARTHLRLGKGTWKFVITNDDGVRLSVDGRPVVDCWRAGNRPERSTGAFTLDEDKTVEVVVEYFEIDESANLNIQLQLVPPVAP